MFSNRPKMFYDSIKPLIYYQRIIGIGIFRQPNQNRLSCFLIYLWSFLINFTGFVCVCFAYYRGYNGIMKTMNTLSWNSIGFLTYLVVIITNCIHTLIAPFLMRLQRKVVWNNFRELQLLDDKFQALLGVDIDQEYRQRFFRICLQLFGINFAMASFSLSFIPWFVPFYGLTLSLVIFASLFQSMSVILTLALNFWILLRYVEKKFRDLNNCLLRLANTNPYPNPKGLLQPDATSNVRVIRPWQETEICYSTEILINEERYFLREIRKLHLEISKLSRRIDSSFGVQNLLTAATTFIILVGTFYKIYETLALITSTNQYFITSQVVGYSISAVFNVFRIWMITHCSWNVTKEAKKTGEVIYELLKSHPNKELQKEIRIFSVQMLKNPVCFNACGLFTLDHIFIKRVIGTISTYLVILIQMSFPPETKNNGQTNGTET